MEIDTGKRDKNDSTQIVVPRVRQEDGRHSKISRDKIESTDGEISWKRNDHFELLFSVRENETAAR